MITVKRGKKRQKNYESREKHNRRCTWHKTGKCAFREMSQFFDIPKHPICKQQNVKIAWF